MGRFDTSDPARLFLAGFSSGQNLMESVDQQDIRERQMQRQAQQDALNQTQQGFENNLATQRHGLNQEEFGFRKSQAQQMVDQRKQKAQSLAMIAKRRMQESASPMLDPQTGMEVPAGKDDTEHLERTIDVAAEKGDPEAIMYLLPFLDKEESRRRVSAQFKALRQGNMGEALADPAARAAYNAAVAANDPEFFVRWHERRMVAKDKQAAEMAQGVADEGQRQDLIGNLSTRYAGSTPYGDQGEYDALQTLDLTDLRGIQKKRAMDRIDGNQPPQKLTAPAPYMLTLRNGTKVQVLKGNGNELVWDEADPIVQAFMDAADASEEVNPAGTKLSRVFGNSVLGPSDQERTRERGDREALAKKLAANVGWKITGQQNPETTDTLDRLINEALSGR